ncbi:MAG TPA: hypothetical protein VGI17_09120 [Solirubrobacterales bacterium]|jgi:hypothetical protein
MRFYWRWAYGWISDDRRRLIERITLGLLDRMGDAPRLDAAQRSWLLQDLREDLDCQIEDAEERGITERRGVRSSTPSRQSFAAASSPPPSSPITAR